MQIVRAHASAITALAIMLSAPCVRAQDSSAAADKTKIEAGENVYNTYCQVCHGDGLVNTGQTFDLRRLTANDRTRFESSVRNGKNQMPPWKGALTDSEIDQVWNYIRAHAYKR
jgi:mono/diheme cytochrome c family protein